VQGRIFFALVVSLSLAGLAARLVSRLYRRRIVKLMSGAAAPAESLLASEVLSKPAIGSKRPFAAETSLSANHKARRRLAFVLIVLSLLVGTSVAWFVLTFVYHEGGFGPVKLLIMGLIYAAPIVPVLGMLGRWSWGRIVATACGYLLFCALIVGSACAARVFRRDVEVEELFDRTIERWRASGSVVLIAGSDLVSRTMNPDDLFAFIEGTLANRFVRDNQTLQKQLAILDTQPDHDGRFRVNDFYCFDTTWQAVLVALVARADRVLMDLRGLTAQNRGCLFELETLAIAQHIKRIVLLCDDSTDRAAAGRSLGADYGDTGTIIWEDVRQMDSAKTEKMLGYLLDVNAGHPG
jgi:hypothetical protein